MLLPRIFVVGGLSLAVVACGGGNPSLNGVWQFRSDESANVAILNLTATANIGMGASFILTEDAGGVKMKFCGISGEPLQLVRNGTTLAPADYDSVKLVESADKTKLYLSSDPTVVVATKLNNSTSFNMGTLKIRSAALSGGSFETTTVCTASLNVGYQVQGAAASLPPFYTANTIYQGNPLFLSISFRQVGIGLNAGSSLNNDSAWVMLASESLVDEFGRDATLIPDGTLNVVTSTPEKLAGNFAGALQGGVPINIEFDLTLPKKP